MKFKYLIVTDMLRRQGIHPSSRPVVYNITDLSYILDLIANECSDGNAKKDEVQDCLEATDLETRMDCVQKIVQKAITMNTYITHIEKHAKLNLRNKKYYEYYSEIMKVAKQVLDGKKTK